MRTDAERADRTEEVRQAARAWHRAGAIDGGTMEAILAAYPDDRARVSLPFRVLLFLFTSVAAMATFGLFAMNEAPMGALFFLSAAATIVLTEIQIGPFRRSGAGAEEATALLAFWFSNAALAWMIYDYGSDFPWRFLCFAPALFAAAAAFRWGIPIFGALSALSLFATLVSWSGARLSWILLGAVLFGPLVVGSTSPRLAPSQRRAVDAALVTVLLALYTALHLGSYDLWLLERTSSLLGVSSSNLGSLANLGGWTRAFFIVATALVPVSVLAVGILWRRPLLLRMGIVLGVASLVTLRFYVHVAPLWVVLSVSGALAIGVGLVLHRFLRDGPDGERHGFTVEPLFDDESRTRLLEVGLSTALAPEARQTSSEPGFRGGGGEFGGGGASGNY